MMVDDELKSSAVNEYGIKCKGALRKEGEESRKEVPL